MGGAGRLGGQGSGITAGQASAGFGRNHPNGLQAYVPPERCGNSQLKSLS